MAQTNPSKGSRGINTLIVEKDWPEYDEVWMAIAMRVDKENGQPSALRSRIDQVQKYGYSPG